MWTCPHCKKVVEAQCDICAKCGSDQSGKVDPLFRFVAQLRKRLLIGAILLPFVYVGSYFLISSYTTGHSLHWSGSTSKRYTYHDRGYPFDPWIYQPLAGLEYWIRGQDSQIVIKDGRIRGGELIYGFGPFE